ncbi:MAG: antibiotic biosynthesis monooxygenase [Angustibacter sp.]
MSSIDAPPTTLIEQTAAETTTITFLHVQARDQDTVTDLAVQAAQQMDAAPGNVSANVLRSWEGTRVLMYAQWTDSDALRAAERTRSLSRDSARIRTLTLNDVQTRQYSVAYADDRSPRGVSVISPSYPGAIFVNEITTQPESQGRLLELVIANNETQSLHTPGYRSANFHRSTDGERAVNYSLWDTEEHCIQAISAMAEMDDNLEETIRIASPDFRFYRVAHTSHTPSRTHPHLPIQHPDTMTTATYPVAVQRLRSRLDATTLARLNAVIAFHFEDGTAATLDGSSERGLGFVEDGPDEHGLTPDLEVALTREDFARLVLGELHPMAGMATGRMKLTGSMRRALALDRLLKS